MSVSITIDDTELQRKIRASLSAIRKDIENAVTKATQAGLNKAKLGTFKDQTGFLRSSLNESEIGWTSQGYWRQIASPAPYSVYVEYPTKRHPIDPVRGKWLHWEPVQGDHHFARHVEHPGTKGYFYMRDASVVVQTQLVTELQHGFPVLRSLWNS